jgi:hypothetical protein
MHQSLTSSRNINAVRIDSSALELSPASNKCSNEIDQIAKVEWKPRIADSYRSKESSIRSL